MDTPPARAPLRGDRNPLIAAPACRRYGVAMRRRSICPPRAVALAALTAALAGCGGGGTTPTSPPPSGGTRTETFSGTSHAPAGGGCSGATAHQINTAGSGQLVITVTQASLSHVGVQVCHPGAVNHALECTVPPFAVIAAGGTLTASIKGARIQSFAVYPAGCDSGTATGPTVNYTISVTYPA